MSLTRLEDTRIRRQSPIASTTFSESPENEFPVIFTLSFLQNDSLDETGGNWSNQALKQNLRRTRAQSTWVINHVS
ncbi:MAG: hypothetical protein CMI18_05560 [Opitutaceae bacterium]|nr:hypothetical protein [Opitutaceae bacterium]